MKYMLCIHSLPPHIVKGEVYLLVARSAQGDMCNVEVNGIGLWFKTHRFVEINTVEMAEDFL